MSSSNKKPVVIRQVYAEDLEQEFLLIRQAIAKYPVVSMDTEFPGTILKADKSYIPQAPPSYIYQFMRANVDALNIIQLGLTLSDAQGNLPDFGGPCCYIWEFNFKDFDIRRDRYDKDSIALLKQQGIDFDKNRVLGIKSWDFARLVLSSGLIFNNSWLTWITFHSVYDFGFLLKILTQQKLPPDIQTFKWQLAYFFGFRIYDIKHTFRFLGLNGGLEKIAKILKVDRVAGESHQAGSDSLLTLQCFMKLKKSKVFEGGANKRILPALGLYGLVQVVGF
ncbi:hypothetical protein REPUB_Repub20aG0124900 [Reevesia pubescens]